MMGWRLTLLSTAFALHNFEEVLRFEAWQTNGRATPAVDPATLAVAVIMLTVTVSVVLAMAVRDRMQGYWGSIAAIIAGGPRVNVAGHAAQSVIALASVPVVYSERWRPPGFWSVSMPRPGTCGENAPSRCSLALWP